MTTSSADGRPPEPLAGGELPEDIEHPRGTFVIMLIFGAVFGLAWLSVYLFVFLHRGVPHS